jgi:hypothetical protein
MTDWADRSDELVDLKTSVIGSGLGVLVLGFLWKTPIIGFVTG